VKAIPLWQPYASLIALGAKTIETRHWPAPASLVGERIAIYATKRTTELRACARAPFTNFVNPLELPLGAIVATAILRKSIEMTDDSIHELAERDPVEIAFGHYAPGRWAWHLSDVEALDPAVPFTWPVRGPAKYVNVPAGLALRAGR